MASLDPSLAELERRKLRPTAEYGHNTTPPYKKKSRMSAAQEWRMEIMSLLAAAAFVAAMVGLVITHDKKPRDQWNAPVTLNALVSILSVAIKGCLLFSVCEAVGQWKWLLFTGDRRRLIEFERIDRASRGPFGCANILAHFWYGTYVLYLGATVALLAIAIDPFTQQIIRTQNEVIFTDLSRYQHFAKDGYVAYNNYFDGGSVNDIPSSRHQLPNGSHYAQYSSSITVAMESAILYGLDKNLTEVQRQTKYRCPSADCRWPPYKSLAVCSECNTIPSSSMKPIDGNVNRLMQTYQNISDPTKDAKRASGWQFSNGQFFANMEERVLAIATTMTRNDMKVLEMTAKSTGNPNKTLTLQHRENLLWAVSIAHFNNTLGLDDSVTWPGAAVLAQECGLYWCVNQYRSSVVNNTYSESVEEVPVSRVREVWDRDGVWPDESLEFHDDVTFVQPLTGFPKELRLCPGTSHDQDDCFWMNPATPWSVNNYFRKLFTANVTPDSESAGLGPGRLENNAHIYGGEMEPDSFKGLWNWKKQDLNQTFQALAYSMSNEIRGSRVPDRSPGRDLDLTMSVGRVTAVYDMRWGWMSLHCVVILLGAVFLCLTILRTGKAAAPVFKSHSLAILTRGAHLSESMAGTERGKDIDVWARKHESKMAADDQVDDKHSQTHIVVEGSSPGQVEEMRSRTPSLNRSDVMLQRELSVSPCSSVRSSERDQRR
ncbi:carboxylic ester hydrolase [Apiospora arundinis]|uniref:Carboxylic ester hydrolase n=1 Tax=Apiospora arundinis TaxID=335852 RepID=A0ABR2ISB8_9PEZI